MQGTNISHQKSLLKMIFLFLRWDVLVPWMVYSNTDQLIQSGYVIINLAFVVDSLARVTPQRQGSRYHLFQLGHKVTVLK